MTTEIRCRRCGEEPPKVSGQENDWWRSLQQEWLDEHTRIAHGDKAMTDFNQKELERVIRSLESLADSFQTLARVQAERLSREFPNIKPAQAAVVTWAGDDKREQYSDKAGREWHAETEAALPPSRFQERFDEERRRPAEVPKKQ